MRRFGSFWVAVVVVASALAAAWGGRGMAQAAGAGGGAATVCQGSVNKVRLSDIKPGMMAKFVEAVAAQKAWYKAAGTPDEITLMRVMVPASGGKTASFSETQAMTSHVEPAASARPKQDKGYDAFVAMYKESSTIKEQFDTCVDKS